jgi:hypothetical protein
VEICEKYLKGNDISEIVRSILLSARYVKLLVDVKLKYLFSMLTSLTVLIINCSKKRLSIADGPSSFASRKKKVKREAETDQNGNCI